MKKLLLLLCISVILLSSCEDFLIWLLDDSGSGNNSGSGTGSGTKRFWAIDTTKNSSDRNYFYQLTAELLAENDLCKVWVERGSGVTRQDAQKMAAEYITIYNKMIGAFGLEFDVEYRDGTKGKLNTIKLADAYTDGDGKLTILLLDIKDGYRKGVNDSYVAGYFTPYNFFRDTNSNSCDMIYIDTNPAFKENPEDAYSTLAHELQHLMNFTTTLENRSKVENGTITEIYQMDTWVDEGLASAAEYVYTGKHLVDRWGWYYLNGDGNGLIDKGNNFFVWGNRENENQYALLDDYATVYLFFQWLRIQSSKGVDIYKDIIGYEVKPADKDYYSENSYLPVTEAASKTIASSYKDNWGGLLGDWLAANYTYASTGRYGYKDDFEFRDRNTNELLTIKGRHFLSTNNTNFSLYPGEGVFSKIDKSYTVPSDKGNIRYSLLTGTGIAAGNSISSGALLTYNASKVNGESRETGTVTGVIPPKANVIDPVNGRSVASQFRITGPYRIGIGDVRRGGFSGLPPIDILQLNSLTLREE